VAAGVYAPSGVTLTCLRVSNFRSLHNIEVPLEALTVLVGANNSGKTTVLDALQVAIGAARKTLGKEDIYLGDTETDVPRDRKAVIDVLIRPVDAESRIIDTFPEGSFWTNLWGSGISQTGSELQDIVAIRTTLEWSVVHGDYRTKRAFLKDWLPFENWLDSEEKVAALGSHIEPIALHYIDAKRDLEDDLKSRGSFWRRLTDDLGLADKDISEFEKSLTTLNQDIIAKSEVLSFLRSTLLDIQNVVSAEKAGVDIAPIPRHLRDLSKGIDVTLSTSGAQSFPLSRHGMGTRSLASLLVFRAFTSWKSAQATKAGDVVHSVLALEEPEAHLHPQAQRALFSQIRLIPGQRLVSTHSPYFAGQSRLEDLRVLTKRGTTTTISRLDVTELSEDDRRKLEREVIASRGDMLFARALILFEGETEEQALPLFTQKELGASIHELGFSFVGVGGNNYFPFILMAKSFNIPWYIFSDGEERPVKALKSQLTRAGFHDDLSKHKNVFVIPNKNDYEAQLIAEGYLDAIEAGLNSCFGAGAIDEQIKSLDGEPGKKVDGKPTVRDYSSAGGRERAALDLMRENKTRVAFPIGQAILALGAPRNCPPFIKAFLEVLKNDFGLK